MADIRRTGPHGGKLTLECGGYKYVLVGRSFLGKCQQCQKTPGIVQLFINLDTLRVPVEICTLILCARCEQRLP